MAGDEINENARRLDCSRPPGANSFRVCGAGALEHAEHDGADKGECDIRGNNAHSADAKSWEASLVHVAAHYNAEG